MESSSFKGDDERALVWNSWNLSTADCLAAIAAMGNNDRTSPLRKCILKKREDRRSAW
jgi:hypothetical protein